MGLVFAPAFGSCFSICRDSIVVSTLRCGRNNPGSNPGHGTFFFLETDTRSECHKSWKKVTYVAIFFSLPKNWARPGFEPGTSRTLSENHTPRPTSPTHPLKYDNCKFALQKCLCMKSIFCNIPYEYKSLFY